MTTATKDKKAKRPKTTGFTFEGEFLDVENGQGREWRSRYEQAARELADAKKAVVQLEDEVKLKLRGHEKLRDDGEVIVDWSWRDQSHFSVTEFKVEFPELYRKFFKTKRGRSFAVNGVANVEVN